MSTVINIGTIANNAIESEQQIHHLRRPRRLRELHRWSTARLVE